jgi:hypothetical protein
MPRYHTFKVTLAIIKNGKAWTEMVEDAKNNLRAESEELVEKAN